MGTTWILDTETKGTGAHMVPLDRVTRRPSTDEPVFKRRPGYEPPREAAEPVELAVRPHAFRIVDLMSREMLADDASVREAVDVLADVRSVVDVNVYTWDAGRGDWRLLTFSERRALWDLAHPVAA